MLMLIAILVVFMSTEYTYDVTAEGIMMSVGQKERKVNRLAILVGLLTGNIRALGAGLLGASREDYFLEWGDVRRVSVQLGAENAGTEGRPDPGNLHLLYRGKFPGGGEGLPRKREGSEVRRKMIRGAASSSAPRSTLLA